MSGNEQQLPEKEADDAPFTKADAEDSDGILPELKIKILNMFFSRKFIVLACAVVAFWLRPESFTGNHLLIAFGLYCAANVSDKFVEIIGFKK